ncbi:MAG: 2-hydroxychromene-2-carboxylate isomerase [Burkholderiales bacterium]|nr:2-hydroxychromene-2-carboxylate isomerase [Burkholderiales bacterium]
MSKRIEYWFDFVSPYAYLTTQVIEQLAKKYDREVDWHPMLLGVVFKHTNSTPLTMRPPVMADYHKHDMERSARFAGLPFVLPEPFPINTQNTARVCLWLKEAAPAQVGEFVRNVTRTYFSEPAALNDIAWLGQQVKAMGLDGEAAMAACENPYYKDLLKSACEEAVSKGIFGAPWLIVDGEAFWGNDRLPQLEKWLDSGGF